MTMTTETKPTTEQTTVQASDKPAYALLEVLVYGTEDKKPEIKKMLDNIQDQMAKCKKGKYARILWYLDKGEKTDEEKKKWLVENANAKYCVFTPTTYLVKPKFISDILTEIRKYEKSVANMKSYGVIPTGKKNEKVQDNSKAN